MENKFQKNERLCGKIDTDKLFSEGKTIKSFPLKMIFMPIESACKTPIKVLVGVPKRCLKKAVLRNRMKRLIRESYRLQKKQFLREGQQYAIAFVYTSREVSPFSVIFNAIENLSQSTDFQ